MHNVLIVSYLFPPSGGVGVPRPIAYARYLPRYDCRTFVLTVKHPNTSFSDPELGKLVPVDTPVFRVFNPEIPHYWKELIWRRLSSRNRHAGDSAIMRSRIKSVLRRAALSAVYRVLFPDIQSTCVPFAISKACQVIQRHAIDTVIIIAPPYSLLKIAVALKRKYPKLKLITDLRDDWLGYYVAPGSGPSDYGLSWSEREWDKARTLERSAFKLSDYVSIASPTWVTKLQERYPDLPPEKFICTTNGYEPDAFSSFAPAPRSKSKFVVTYFGTLNTSRVYSPETYLEALDGLPAHIRESFETRVIGRVTPDCHSMLVRRNDVRELGFLPKHQGIQRLQEADLLLLIATGRDSQAGKLFDYLATAKPIMALSPPDGEIASVLRETGTGWAVDPFNAAEIRQQLEKCYQALQTGKRLTAPDRHKIEGYSWPKIVEKLAHQTGIAEPRTAAVISPADKLTV